MKAICLQTRTITELITTQRLDCCLRLKLLQICCGSYPNLFLANSVYLISRNIYCFEILPDSANCWKPQVQSSGVQMWSWHCMLLW